MVSPEVHSVIQRGQQIYEQRLKADLEKSHMHDYVVIEPESWDHYVGHTMGEATAQSRAAHPGQITYIMRVGHGAAFHIGGCG
jgi:hypothetical protein